MRIWVSDGKEARPRTSSFGRLPAEPLQTVQEKGMNMPCLLLVALNKSDNLKVNKTGLEKSIFSVRF